MDHHKSLFYKLDNVIPDSFLLDNLLLTPNKAIKLFSLYVATVALCGDCLVCGLTDRGLQERVFTGVFMTDGRYFGRLAAAAVILLATALPT